MGIKEGDEEANEVSSIKVVIGATGGDEAEQLSEVLMECGGSVVISEHRPDGVERDQLFDAHGAGKELWGECSVECYFYADSDVAGALGLASGALGRELRYVTEPIFVRDWVAAIRDEYKPVQACEGVWVVPAGSAAPQVESFGTGPGASINVVLEPGLAFGTGEHPTTRLCLEYLRGEVSGGERVVDYGSGSGVLAIAAVKFGAAFAQGTDTDPLAVRVSGRNAVLNGASARCAFVRCSPSSTDEDPLPGEKYDMVIANILQGPLFDLRDRLANYGLPGSKLALSGIIAEQVPGILEHYGEYFEGLAVRQLGDWALVCGTRKYE